MHATVKHEPLPGPVLRAIYGLTLKETEVALALAAGRTLKEVASDLGVSYATVRTHLKQVFAKTGVDRQAALVRLLLTGAPGEGPPQGPRLR